MSTLKFKQLLDEHDWTYEYSDDPLLYSQGLGQWYELKRLIATNPEFKRLYEERKSL